MEIIISQEHALLSDLLLFYKLLKHGTFFFRNQIQNFSSGNQLQGRIRIHFRIKKELKN